MVYEYKCSECGEVVSKNMPMEEEHPQKVYCPVCKKKTASRVFSNVSTHIPYEFTSTDNRIKTEKKPSKRYY